MSGKIPADADRYRADGCVGRRQLTEALSEHGEALLHSPDGNFTENAWDIYPTYEFENDEFKITVASPRG